MPVLTIRDSLNAVVAGLGTGGMTQFGATLPVPQTFTPAQVLAETNNLVKRRKVAFLVSDAGTAATAVTEEPVFFVDGSTLAQGGPGGLSTGIRIVSVNVAFPVAVTANNSNYATITISKRTSGGAAVIVATETTQITDPVLGANAVAFQQYAITLSATIANQSLAAGTDVLTVLVSKTGTGVAIASATASAMVSIVYEEV